VLEVLKRFLDQMFTILRKDASSVPLSTMSKDFLGSITSKGIRARGPKEILRSNVKDRVRLVQRRGG
jgi:hypothetical protein